MGLEGEGGSGRVGQGRIEGSTWIFVHGPSNSYSYSIVYDVDWAYYDCNAVDELRLITRLSSATYADNVALPAFARRRTRRSVRPSLSSKMDRLTDARQMHRPCST